MRRSLALSVATALLLAAGCGSDDDEAANDAVVVDDADAADDPAAESADEATTGGSSEADTDTVAEADGDTADDGLAVPSGAGFATVNFEGQTYNYAQIEPGADDDWFVLCTTIGDSLQAVLQQVDDAGNAVVGGEISVILLEPGGAYEQTGDPPEVSISIDNERFLQYEVGDPIAAPASGSSGGGTATVREFGSLDAQTGEIETTSHEVEFQVSC